jgi:hypothetical protein
MVQEYVDRVNNGINEIFDKPSFTHQQINRRSYQELLSSARTNTTPFVELCEEITPV